MLAWGALSPAACAAAPSSAEKTVNIAWLYVAENRHDPTKAERIVALLKELPKWRDANVRFVYARMATDEDVSLEMPKLRALPVDAYFAVSPGLVIRVRKQYPKLPMVFESYSDPVPLGLIDSYRIPGNGLTGVLSSRNNNTKYMETLVACANSNRLAYVTEEGPGLRSEIPPSVLAASKAVGVELVRVALRADSNLLTLGDTLKARGFGGAMAGLSEWLFENRAALATQLNRANIPTIFADHRFVQSGGLMGLTVDTEFQPVAIARRLDMVLRGYDPGTIPFELPQQLKLSVNASTLVNQSPRCKRYLMSVADVFFE